MTVIATLVNQHAIADLKILLFTLQLWNDPAPSVYIYCDTASLESIKSITYSGEIITKVALNAYTGLDRQQMEKKKGVIFRTLFADFCSEKTKLVRWAMRTSNMPVIFCDADICHLGPLPTFSSQAKLILSPHMIRKYDEGLFGKYNAGYLFISEDSIAEKWFQLCSTSHFFEQGCLEELSDWVKEKNGECAFSVFPKTINYGWWRLCQSDQSIQELQAEWSISRKEAWAGLAVAGQPLQSIHTHWLQKNDPVTAFFNNWVLSLLKKLSSVKKTAQLIRFLEIHR
jgi:hypothetical protein